MTERTDTGDGNISLKREVSRYAHSWVQYGALGMLLVFFLGMTVYLVHIFVPLLVQRFQTDEAAKTLQTAAVQKVANAMESFDAKLEKSLEMLRSQESLCAAKRR